MKSCSVSNLRYMKWFYQRYCGCLFINNSEDGFPKMPQQVAVESKTAIPLKEHVQQLAVELFSIPWGHYQIIIGKCSSLEESIFYVHETTANIGGPTETQMDLGDNLTEKNVEIYRNGG